jgi:hypothetical protein
LEGLLVDVADAVLAAASMAMLVRVMRSSRLSDSTPSPAKYMAL